MLENMFIGRPPGNYDRLLDFSQALTGSLFFVPSATFLGSVGDDTETVMSTAQPMPAESPKAGGPRSDGSLNIGSLKGDKAHE
jgi:putative iron-dependent peroxidase